MAERKDHAVSAVRISEATADKIAKDIMKDDGAIEILIIVDDMGNLISLRESERLDEADREPNELLQKYATLTTILLGAADVKDERLGGLELMVISYGKAKVILMKLPEYKVTLGMRVNRSALGEHIYREIADMFAANKDLLI